MEADPEEQLPVLASPTIMAAQSSIRTVGFERGSQGSQGPRDLESPQGSLPQTRNTESPDASYGTWPGSSGGQPWMRRSSASFDPASTPLTAMQHHMTFPPEESVYSYLTFMLPIEQRRTGKFITNLTLFATVLVLVNFVMQTGLLYVVGGHIMKKHNEWVSSVAALKHHAWYHVFPMPYNQAPGKCRTKDSPLCFDHGDGISCAPTSVHVLTDWHLLDTDGDGIWSREEAEDEKLRENMQCEYDVDLLSLYSDVVKDINASEAMQGRQDINLRTGVAVHKAYLNWFLHKPLLCTYGDQDMCGALFQRGFFDEALRQQSSHEFKDTASALKYCNDLLQFECYNILPNTYKVWRFVSNQQCGAKIFGQEEYHNPVGGGTFPMLSVDFRKRREYSSTKTMEFRTFLAILLVTFLSVMALEMRSILKCFIWCGKFPIDADDDDGRIVSRKSVHIITGMGGETAKKSILATRLDHRVGIGIMTMMRLCLWCFLMWSGIMFLTGPPRYLTLIFDALSLVFIFEIDELLYRTMLRHEFQRDHMDIADMKVPSWHGGIFTGSASVLGDLFWLLGVIALGVAIVWTYCKNELNPLLDSLECLCAAQGEQCFSANHYTKTWWDTYWSTMLPASNLIIDQLKEI